MAEQLEQLNRERQQIEAEITSKAAASLLEDELAAAIVLASRDWHLGVVGIVAARLVDRFHRPSDRHCSGRAGDRQRIGTDDRRDSISTRDWLHVESCWRRSAAIQAPLE